MAKKTCPGCQAQHGPRTLICNKCDFEFKKSTQKNTSSYINLGSWINDTGKGMPRVEIPEPLPPEPKKLEIDEIVHYIVHEGLGYCVMDYIPHKRIRDAALSKLWVEAKKKLTEIVKYVEQAQITNQSIE